MKLLKRLILFFLACETDFFKKQASFSYHPYRYLYWRLLKYSQSSIRDVVLQLIISGEIDKIKQNGKVLFCLTGQGKERLLRFFPLSSGQSLDWDNVWRIVIISPLINSKNISKSILSYQSKTDNKVARSNLRYLKSTRRLKSSLVQLGFRQLSMGVYLSPLPVLNQVRDLFLQEGLMLKALAIESSKLIVGESKQLAYNLWSLEEIFNQYLEFIRQANRLIRLLNNKKKLINQAKKEYFTLAIYLFTLMEVDPGLPKQLLPINWPFTKALKLFFDLTTKVANLEMLEKPIIS